MAKYRITSIPQYRDGGKKKKQQPVTQSGWNSPVEGFESNSPLSAFIPNQSMVEQPTQYTIDPNQVDKPMSERTGLELLATQPEFGDVGYGYKRDLFTGKLKIVPAGTQTYEKDMFGNLITNVKANPDAPVTYTGQELNCGPGKRPYKGVCLTDEEYAQIQAKEEANISYWNQEEKKRIAKEQEEAFKKIQEDYKKEIDSYIATATKKGNKHKKGSLEPFRTYDKKAWEYKQPSGGSLQDWYNDQNPEIAGKSAYYLDKKDLGNGNYEVRLYPRQAIQGMMVQYGVQPGEFERFHGLDAKQLTKEYAPFLESIHKYYLAQGQDFIDKWTKQGLSAEEAKRKLITDKNYGVKSGIESNFKDIAEHFDFQNNATKYYVDDYGVMYTKDRSGNVYKYTNDPENEDFQVFDYYSTDENENPFAPVNDKNYSKQGTFTWQPVDKSKSKVSIDAQGDLNINGKEAKLFDHEYKGRDKKKNENTILTNYKDYINKGSKEIAQQNKLNQTQYSYAQKNAEMFDHVYGNPDKTDLEEISAADILNSNLQHQYVNEYNNAVRKINAINKKAGTQSQTDAYRKQKGKIVEEFINKVKNTGPKFGDKKVDFGALPGYQTTFTGRDITAYKDNNKYKIQRSSTTNEEANAILRYAYENNINPSARNIQDSEYRGEKEDWNKQWINYEHFATSPEARKFLKDYKKQPQFGRELFDEAYRIKGENLAQDEYNKKYAATKQRFKTMTDNMPWYAKAIDQGMSLIQYPYDTIMDWGSGELQAPLLGLIGDQPYTADLDWLENTFGTGASRIYQENLLPMQQNPISQFTSLINPTYFAGLTGRGLNRRLVHDDPEATWEDVGMNALFATMPVSKLVQAGMAAKPLMGLSKYVPAALKTGTYLPRIGNAVATTITPGNALTGYFAGHALLPHTNEVTGETTPGFFVDALDKTYDALKGYGTYDPNKPITIGDKVVGYGDYTDASDVWKGISPNLVNLYMGKSILGHSGQILNRGAGSLVGKPSLLNTSRITDPLKAPMNNALQNFTNSPRPYIHPTTGKLYYIRSMSDLPFMNSNRFGIDYKQKGGQVLPKANRGLPVRVKEKKPIEIKIPEPKTIRKNITKELANISFTNYLNSTAPETMNLISNLKSQGIISPVLPEGKLVTYPNLLNLATKRGIQDALTFARFTEPSLVEGVSSSGTRTPLSALDLKAYVDYDLLGDPAGMAMYSASHIPGMRYGRRDGLSRLPYETEYVGGRKQGTPESLDALYTFPSFSSQPRHIRQGIMSPTYGSYGTILRYPFDYSGSAMDMFNRFRNFENETAAQAKLMQRTGGREGALPGLIGGFKFSEPLGGFKNSGIDPVFFQSWMGPPEAPIIGHPGQKVLEPVFTQTKPILKEMAAETADLEKLYYEGKYEELINKLNDKIKSGDFGSPESNIEQIKIRQKEKSNVRPYIDVSKYNRHSSAMTPFQSEYIDPKTGLISLEGNLEKIANDAIQMYISFMEYGPELDAIRNPSNFVRTYYSPLRFKFKKGGELPKANRGLPVRRNIKDFTNPRNEWENFKQNQFDFNPEINIPTYRDFYKSPPVPPPPVVPKLDQRTIELTKNIPPDSFSPIRFGDDYAAKGHEWYYVDPADYYPLVNWKELARKDANKSLNESISKLPNYGSETFKGIGDYEFEFGSDGSEARNQMMQAFDLPQWYAKGEDFFSRLEFNDMMSKQLEYDMARMKFDDILFNRGKMDDYVKSAKATELGLPPYDPEFFAELFPGVSMPNWRSKFTRPEQEEFLRAHVGSYNPSVRNTGLLNTNALKSINSGFDILSKKNKGLTPFTGGDAWRQISSQPGYKNKRGGISMKLTKAEIDKYVKGGYIVEEE